MFDDDKPIQVFSSWEAVLNHILQYGNLPTLLLYEKSKQKTHDPNQVPLSDRQVKNLYRMARGMQAEMDEIER